jgi:hypothetical protein
MLASDGRGVVMMKKTIWFCLAYLTLLAGSAVHGQMMSQGTVVRVMGDELVFIDMGLNANIMEGDLFNIVSNEIVYHPLVADSVLVSTLQKIGVLQVLQVYPKIALAKLIQIRGGEDPMLKQITRIEDHERLVEIEILMQQQMRGTMGGVPRRLALVPGLYQINMGERRKGWVLLGVEAVSLIVGFSYRASSNSWKEQYDRLQSGLPESEYDRYFDTAQSQRSRSQRFFWLAGAAYAYSWFDVLWDRGGAPMNMQRFAPTAFDLGLGSDQKGRALLQLVRRF